MAKVISISKLINSDLFTKYSGNDLKVLIYLLHTKNTYILYEELVNKFPYIEIYELNNCLCKLRANEYISYPSLKSKIKVNRDQIDFIIDARIRVKKEIVIDENTKNLFDLFSTKLKYEYKQKNKRDFPLKHITGQGYPTPNHLNAFGAFCNRAREIFNNPQLGAFFDSYINFLLNDGLYKYKVTSYWIIISSAALEVFKATNSEIREKSKFDKLYERTI